MKKVEAIVRPGKLDEIKDALAAAEILDITVTHALGFGLTKRVYSNLSGARGHYAFIT